MAIDSSFREVRLPREFIKLSPISSAIIPHRTPDGHVSKTGYVKLLAFSQVLNYQNLVLVYVGLRAS